MAKLTVLNPVALVKVSKSSFARRPASLDNKRIGLYWNAKFGGDKALAHVEQLLKGKLEGAEFKLIKSSVPGTKDAVNEAKSFDAVIASTGD